MIAASAVICQTLGQPESEGVGRLADEDRDDLSLADVIKRTRLDKNKIRALADAGYIRTWRPPTTGRGSTHRRFFESSVDEFVAAMREPDGEEKTARLEGMRRRNLGLPEPE